MSQSLLSLPGVYRRFYIYNCPTTPLYIKTVSDYIILPDNNPAGLYNSIYSPKTFGNVIEQLTIKNPGRLNI